MFTNLNLCAVTDEFGRCSALGDVVQKRIDKLFIGLDRIHICSVDLSTNKKLSRGNATIDCRSVGVDGMVATFGSSRGCMFKAGFGDLY
jgi:hypothetical protein